MTWKSFEEAPRTGECILLYNGVTLTLPVIWDDAGQRWMDIHGNALDAEKFTDLFWVDMDGIQEE